MCIASGVADRFRRNSAARTHLPLAVQPLCSRCGSMIDSWPSPGREANRSCQHGATSLEKTFGAFLPPLIIEPDEEGTAEAGNAAQRHVLEAYKMAIV